MYAGVTRRWGLLSHSGRPGSKYVDFKPTKLKSRVAMFTANLGQINELQYQTTNWDKLTASMSEFALAQVYLTFVDAGMSKPSLNCGLVQNHGVFHVIALDVVQICT